MLKSAAETQTKLLSSDYMKLSIAAKTWFLLGEKRGSATPAELEALAPRFGWSVTPDQIHEAAQSLSEAELVESRPR